MNYAHFFSWIIWHINYWTYYFLKIFHVKWARTEFFQKLLIKDSNGPMNLKSVILAWDKDIRPHEFTRKQKQHDIVGLVDNRYHMTWYECAQQKSAMQEDVHKAARQANRYTRLDNLAWSHPVFWPFIFCRKCRFTNQLILFSVDTFD